MTGPTDPSTEPPTDPFAQLASPPARQTPRPSFARDLRSRLVDALGPDPIPPTVQLPRRRFVSPTTATTAVAVPYLTATDASAAIGWYAEAFGAVEQFRVVGDDGTIGHAEFTIAGARFMLSDEHPAMGVVSPTTLGGTPFAIHLTVGDVDTLFAQAVAAGATAQMEPADQPHGSRHGSLLDPYGHRWMVSQELEAFDVDTYAERSDGSGYTVEAANGANHGTGGIWAEASYTDALAGIRLLIDVFGFEEQLVVTDDDDSSVVIHSQIRWPEGGIVQVGTYVEDNEFVRPPGEQSLYVITSDPQSVWERCQAAGLDVVRPPEAPHYDPDGMGFSVRDRERNIWSFGTYAGEV